VDEVDDLSSMDTGRRLRNPELERREKQWRENLDRSGRQRRHELERDKQDALHDIEQRKDDARRDLERHARDQEQRRGGGGLGGGRGQEWEQLDDLALRWAVYVAAALAVAGVFVLTVGHLSALFFSGGWPRYETREIPGVLGRVVRNPADPGAAWEPVNHGAEIPGPLGWWAVFLVLLLVVGSVGLLLYALASTRPAGGRASARGAGSVPRAEHRRLRVREGGEGRLVVGTSGRWKLAIPALHSLLVVGPAHSGKTSGLAIPALLEWSGPAVVASTKGHLMDETIGWRSHQGDVHVFDPAAVSRYHRSGWSLLHDCGTWQGAIRTARHLTVAAKATLGGRIDGGDPGKVESGAMWTSAMAMALAPYLYAAAADGRPILDAAEWIEREERDEVLSVLRSIDRTAAHAHETTFFRDDPSRSTFFHYMYQVLSVYGDPTVSASSARHEIVAGELLDGGRHTLYLTAPEHDQIRFQPLFATIVRQILTAASDRFASEGSTLDPPLLLLLDEAVGVASVEELAVVASGGAAQGVQVISIFEDLSRFDRLQANASGLIARNHRAKLVLPGNYRGSAAGSVEPLLPAVQARQLTGGEGALLYDAAPPVRVQLRRWYHDGELRRRVETEQDAVAPSDSRPPRPAGPPPRNRSPVDDTPDYSLVDQAGAWNRVSRRRRPESPDDTEADRSRDRDRERDRSSRLVSGVVTTREGETLPDNVTPLGRDRHRR
jgi:type IV secretion system protein VirD4